MHWSIGRAFSILAPVVNSLPPMLKLTPTTELPAPGLLGRVVLAAGVAWGMVIGLTAFWPPIASLPTPLTPHSAWWLTAAAVVGVQSAFSASIGWMIASRAEPNRGEVPETIAEQLAAARQREQLAERRNAKLHRLMAEDALTGCQNRRALDEQGDALIAQSHDAGRPIACVMVDLDHFKTINDTHGHAAGDAVLRHVGEMLRRVFAGVGPVFRYGGEEFCVLLPGHNAAEAGWNAERMRVAIEAAPVPLADGETLHVTASVGVADVAAGHAMSCGTLIDRADQCLYAAKRGGRNQVVTFNDEIAAMRFRKAT